MVWVPFAECEGAHLHAEEMEGEEAERRRQPLLVRLDQTTVAQPQTWKCTELTVDTRLKTGYLDVSKTRYLDKVQCLQIRQLLAQEHRSESLRVGNSNRIACEARL